MMRFEYEGALVLVDYAHNPDGLRGFLSVATQLRGKGRLALLLGHAGNRQDADIVELARTAVEFNPDLIVIKEDEAHLRGRAPGEIPRIIRDELLRLGLAESALPVRDNELDAARYALQWARPGDVLALPLHSPSARAAVMWPIPLVFGTPVSLERPAWPADGRGFEARKNRASKLPSPPGRPRWTLTLTVPEGEFRMAKSRVV